MNLLLLRGLARDQRHWAKFPDSLRKVLPEVNLHFLDLPGAGRFKAEGCPGSIEENVEFLRVKWKRLKKAEPWALLGMSLGGMIALRWAAKYEDFENIFVVNTSSANTALPWERMKPGSWFSVLSAMALQNYPLKSERLVLSLTTRLINWEERAKQWSTLQDESKTISLNGVLKQIRAASSFQSPSRIQSRLVVISSKGDQLVSPRCSESLANSLGAIHVSHPCAGHDLALDDPDWLAKVVADNLSI